VEGGAETLWEFFGAGLVDAVAVFVAPRVLGGAAATAAVGGAGFRLRRAASIEGILVETVGEDFLVTGRVAGNG
jgi:diaminohydroxyphosphoribosylaminopyrimidine deaminase/5-amino-6-(5-phosphoribosylamino)uracil reductase